MIIKRNQMNSFIYCTDNIPDHRSRRYGCCASQMTVRKLLICKTKMPHLSCNSDTASAK